MVNTLPLGYKGLAASRHNPKSQEDNAKTTTDGAPKPGNPLNYDAPKPVKTFDRNGYRAQVRVANDAQKPGMSVNLNGHRGQAHSSNNTHNPGNTFNKNAYRNPRANNDFNKSNSTFRANGYRGQAEDSFRGNNNALKKEPFQKPQNRQVTQNAKTSTNKDEYRLPTEEELVEYVRDFYREANADYERDKAAGRSDTYIPADGRQPDFSDFRKRFNGTNTKAGGLKDSMHAPKKAPNSVVAKPQGRN
ncbi:hypothetical protein QBC32DRAFT_393467 [Pseudoneurospora amorphoporcata]|uniref:Uncharacterized protein n=1 Tax=Pseudoneurospora amorphoporcata TaxID=241081 RepID=A0AAN6NSG5_9PEZI|nr:hypothetical protein QBC32DRAFT_393467 [Pseudoneurospora amorphoporcata]